MVQFLPQASNDQDHSRRSGRDHRSRLEHTGAFDTMNNLNPHDGLNDFLAEVFETLRRHEQSLYRMNLDIQAVIGALKIRDSGTFVADFESCHQAAEIATASQRESQSRLFDELIARLRGS